MAQSNFTNVMEVIFRHEGGYVDHPRDPGGATNMGITHITLAAWRRKTVTKSDVRALTKDEASAIYEANYWQAARCDALPYGIDLTVMDGSVNSGPRRGVCWLQGALGVAQDGRVGGVTIAAARSAPVEVIQRACARRMGFLRGLSHWDAFGRGWSRRVADVEAIGTRMWLRAAGSTHTAVRKLEELATQAPKQAQDERRSGAAQVTTTGAGSVGGVSVGELSIEAIAAVALTAVIVAALLYWRAERKARYHEDRQAAYTAQLEELK